MAAATGIRVLVADDQAIVRQGLEVILSSEPGLVVAGVATNGEEAVSRAAELRPDVVLMDLKMPKLNGIHATQRITRQMPSVKVLVLTTYDGDEWLFDALRAGACGYLLKDSDGDAIVAAVRGAAAGEVHLDPHVAGKVLQAFNQQGGPPSPVAHTTATPNPESVPPRRWAQMHRVRESRPAPGSNRVRRCIRSRRAARYPASV